MKLTEAKNNAEFVVYFVLPPLILLLGLVGNITSVVILTKSKKLNQIGPVCSYKYLFVTDTLTLLLTLTNNYFSYGFSMTFSLLNDFTCKVYKYSANLFASLSTFILLYILVERFLAIKFPVESNLLRGKKYQSVYFVVGAICLSFSLWSFYLDSLY